MENNKRKRTANTSTEQYEIYLEEMEKDYNFRSGTASAEYIEKKWDSLARKLNAVGKGPALSKIIWRKRFKDWKNATRAKYRRLSRQMGRKELDEIGLNPLEERGLEVWGTTGVTEPSTVRLGLESPTDTKPVNEIEIVQTDDNSDEMQTEPENISNSNIGGQPLRAKSSFTMQGRIRKRKFGTATSQKMNSFADVDNDVSTANYIAALKDIGDSLEIAINKFTSTYEKVNEQKYDIENRKLEFEMKKFRFENPDFSLSQK